MITIINVESNPQGVAYDSFHNRVHVTNVGSNSVSVIDASTNKVVATVKVGIHPQDVVYSSGNGRGT